MKLDQESLDYIVSVVRAAKDLGAESLVIEPNRIRAADEDVKRVILHTTNVQSMPFGSIGMTRPDIFLARYELAKSTAGMYVEYTTRGEDPLVGIKEDKNAMFAHTLTFKGKGLKLDFRPSNPMVIRAPRTLNDKLKFRALISEELIHFIVKGKKAVGTDEFTLIINDDGGFIEMTDINNDKLSFQFTETIERVDPTDESKANFSKTFPIAYAEQLFRGNIGAAFHLSDKHGYLEVNLNNLTSLILPKV